MTAQSSEPSLAWYATLLGALLLVALVLIEVLSNWEQRRLVPFRNLEPGMTAAEVENRVGPADYVFVSDDELREAAEGWNFLCHMRGQSIPEGVGYIDRSNRYYDGSEAVLKPFPMISGQVDLYRPAFLHGIMVYLDHDGVVTRILVCAP
ncbi:MAG: hypothetical protein GY720_24175 [bacterium]|nr:hypothetical protein [bacterium]